MTHDEQMEDLRAAFGDEADTALAVLRAYDSPQDEVGTKRVRRAIVTLSHGDIDRLRHFTERARQDFRDVLFWAENPPQADEPSSYSALRERLGLPPDPDHARDDAR